MDYLEEINKKVQQKLKLKNKDIILGFYQTLINNHNEFCGCNYCLLLEKYVNLRKYKSSLNKRYNEYELDLTNSNYNLKLELEYCNNYRTLEYEIKNLKIEKNKLKQL